MDHDLPLETVGSNTARSSMRIHQQNDWLKINSQSNCFPFYTCFADGAGVMFLVVTDSDDPALPGKEVFARFETRCLKYDRWQKKFLPGNDMNKQSIFWICQFLRSSGFTPLAPKICESQQSLVSLMFGRKTLLQRCKYC